MISKNDDDIVHDYHDSDQIELRECFQIHQFDHSFN